MNTAKTIREAIINSRAQEIITAGYTFLFDAEAEMTLVFKPGRYEKCGAFDYLIDEEGCSCRAFAREGFCKHSFAARIMQNADAAEAAACQMDVEAYRRWREMSEAA